MRRMFAMKCVLSLLMWSMSTAAYASVVQWNAIEFYSAGGYAGFQYVDEHATIGMDMQYIYAGGNIVSAQVVESFGMIGNPASYWIRAYAGDSLVTYTDFASRDMLYDCYPSSMSGVPTNFELGKIDFSSEKDIYYIAILGAYAVNTDSPKNYWAWIELEGSQNTGLTMIRSALSYESPLIVGGGVVIPEPSSALLIMMGVAIMVLKRR